jgi:aminoglycoside N3'-acetyltransferase
VKNNLTKCHIALSKISRCSSSSRFVLHSDLTILGKDLLLLKHRELEFFVKALCCESLAVPTFNLEVPKGNLGSVDFRATTSELGALSTAALLYDRSGKGMRLPNPVHSYPSIPALNSYEIIDNNRSFGKNSVFDYFYRNDFTWINFGADVESGFTLFHHVEKLCDVPYRSDLNFVRNMVFPSFSKTSNFNYFARNTNEFSQNLSVIVNLLVDCNVIKVIDINHRKIFYGSVREIVDCSCKLVTRDPYLLVAQNSPS